MRSHVAKEHPDHVLPPKGTILNIKALARIAQETENDAKLLKIN
jgi:hypothetical protein